MRFPKALFFFEENFQTSTFPYFFFFLFFAKNKYIFKAEGYMLHPGNYSRRLYVTSRVASGFASGRIHIEPELELIFCDLDPKPNSETIGEHVLIESDRQKALRSELGSNFESKSSDLKKKNLQIFYFILY